MGSCLGGMAQSARTEVTALAHGAARLYERHRPERSTLYEVVRDNLETHAAVDEGALAFKLPKHARKELEAYLDCGLLCRGFRSRLTRRPR